LINVLSLSSDIAKFLVIYVDSIQVFSMALKIGDKAPNFTLKDSFEREVSLSDFEGKRIIIYFYPKDNTPGCTKEACNFKENWDLLKKNNFVILGISKDDASSHQKFLEKFDLPFILLTDSLPCKVASDYDSYGLKKFMGKEYMGMIRNTFVIDVDGNIEKIYQKIKAAIMADHIIADLKIS
tara:strand:- start:1262 stop:1807 length:546 start_codon:yes stop_codon:yes gene_type:complete